MLVPFPHFTCSQKPRKEFGLSLFFFLLAFVFVLPTAQAQQAQTYRVGILVPLTGFLALEGESQRNGALLALENPPAALKQAGITLDYEIFDTGSNPEGASLAFNRLLSYKNLVAISGPILGTQMLAILPLARDAAIPLLTISGTASLTQQGNPWVFRFFPGDSLVKNIQVRYAVEERKLTKPVILYQTTAYGQSGLGYLQQYFQAKNIAVLEAVAIDPNTRDLTPILLRLMEKHPDSFIVQLHAASNALLIQQARQMGIGLPIIAGSAMHQPSTAALLSPKELNNVCAETGTAPLADQRPDVQTFVTAYQKRFNRQPDAFALAQYDALQMLMQALAATASENHLGNPSQSIMMVRQQIQHFLTTSTFQGVGMPYVADTQGNMAHSGLIICYDGNSRLPVVAKRYE